MSAITKFVNITLTSNNLSPTQKNFKTPLFMAHTPWSDPFRLYGDLTSMVTDGFSTGSAAYLMVQAALSQNPRPKQVMIGKLTNPQQQVVQLTVQSGAQGTVTALNIQDATGAVHLVTRTAPSSSSASAEATAVAALIASISGVASATAVGAVITVTITTAGDVWYFLPPSTPAGSTAMSNLTYLDNTADASVDTDLTNLEKITQAFYGVVVQYRSAANANKLKTWLSSRSYIGVASSADDQELSSSVIFAAWKTASVKRTAAFFSRSTSAWPACALLGEMLPKPPGSANFAFKALQGVTPDNLTATQTAYLDSQNVNYYDTTAGLALTENGIMPDGTYIDDVVGSDALVADMGNRIFALLANNDKIPYTDAGISMVAGEMRSSLKKFARAPYNYLDPGNGSDVPAPFVTQPAISDIDPADRKGRILPDMQFGARKAGAVNDVEIVGNLSI